MLETTFKNRFIKKLRKIGGWWYKSSDRYIAGIPDIIGCFNGSFIAFELKVKPNKATALQKYNIQGITKNGGIAYIVYPEDEEKYLNMLMLGNLLCYEKRKG